mmetsp:Transcript_51992/g.169882  ORF Transcript_51992/g.169882 Transcript_51992/m.169882 type:complete len:112 (+) Transcript_51992:54-389(+)
MFHHHHRTLAHACLHEASKAAAPPPQLWYISAAATPRPSLALPSPHRALWRAPRPHACRARLLPGAPSESHEICRELPDGATTLAAARVTASSSCGLEVSSSKEGELTTAS